LEDRSKEIVKLRTAVEDRERELNFKAKEHNKAQDKIDKYKNATDKYEKQVLLDFFTALPKIQLIRLKM